ncbi:hypothetical protein VN0612_05280 [Helicobacter pylori]
MLGGIALVLVVRLLRGYFKITFPLITLKKPPLKSTFFILKNAFYRFCYQHNEKRAKIKQD